MTTELEQNFKRKRKWEMIKDRYMTIDLFSLLIEGVKLDEALGYTYEEYQVPSMDWAG